MKKYIDAHCHLISDADIAAARRVGVDGFVCNCTDESQWAGMIEFAARNQNVRACVGIHPWYVDRVTPGWDTRMCDLLAAHPTLMVGEVGIDTTRPDVATQLDVFLRQIEMAHAFGRVAHVHCVGAWDKIIAVLQHTKLPPAVVFHAYNGNANITAQLVKLNGWFSFGPMVKNPRYKRARDAVMNAPENRILVESDAPDSGMCSADIPHTVTAIAALRGMPTLAIADILYNNTTQVLKHGQTASDSRIVG